MFSPILIRSAALFAVFKIIRFQMLVSNAPAVNEVLESESGEEQLLLHRDRLTKQQRLEIECKKARYQVRAGPSF